jgi:two-component system nitrate/nitrite response regulator NarL
MPPGRDEERSQPDAHGPTRRWTACIVAGIRMYREGLEQELGRSGFIQVVGTARDWPSCLALVRLRQPDAVVLDLAVVDGLGPVADLLVAAPGVHVIALAVTCAEDAVQCAEAGMAGYMTCDDSLDELARRIDSVCRGEMPCTPEVASHLFRRVADLARHSRPAPVVARLTRREHEIVALIDDGLSNKEIARHLSIELTTVKNHVHNILDKVEARRRGEIAPRLRAAATAGRIEGSGSSPGAGARRSGTAA